MIRGKPIMKVNDTTVALTERAVVSDKLKKDIRAFVEDDFEVALNVGSMLDVEIRENVVNDVTNLMMELYRNKVIDQYDVICDNRNNTEHDRSKGITKVFVKFRQWNCINTTVLEYTMTREKKIRRHNKKKRFVI
jgi:hypothetical protein